MCENVVWFHLRKIKLLRAKDGTRSSDSDPSNEALCGDLEMLHCPEADQSSGSSEASFAMDGYGSVIWLIEVSIHNFEEVFHYVIWWRRAINKEQLCVVYSIINEVVFIILFFVEPNNSRNIGVLEYLYIFIWMLSVSVFGIPLLNGPHKCSKLARDDPIHISILYPLIILVFLDIE